ncbi:MAG TPA: DNA mismatch repair protein MutS, partial [Alphaproteobacteria bacterium]|nr:DNA mismatch repair protein MutS [Alphaproteobacteria bacterium]
MNEREAPSEPRGAPGGPPEAEGATPVMAQYLEVKRAHPDCLLFFRLGDFYELFFEDAVRAAGALDIALTRRGRHQGEDVPMCGVPAHAHEAYLHRLIAKGFKVAICEQLEDPAEARQRGARAVVKREVVRVITPGTLTEETLLDARAANFLAALARAEGRHALAWLDVSTGAFSVEAVEPKELAATLARLEPGEILVSEALVQEPGPFELFGEWKARLTPRPTPSFDSQRAAARLQAFYRVASLDGLGSFGRAELSACGALLDYLELTQKGRLPYLGRPRIVARDSTVTIDPATRRNLELVQSVNGTREGSLLEAIDRTLTGAGGRLLRQRLSQPLTEPAAIDARLDAVDFFCLRPTTGERLRAELVKVPDLERALSRLALLRGTPRDLAALREGLGRIPELRRLLAASDAAEGGLASRPPFVALAERGLGHHAVLVDRLKAALVPAPPPLAREGGFIAKGYSAELDEFRTLRDEGRRLIAALETRYREMSGIAPLKIRHNNVIGYFIEVPPAHAARMGEPFRHRQSLASAARYGSQELAELEDKMGRAAAAALALELKLFDDLVSEVSAHADEIAKAAQAMAELDVYAALATLAAARRYTRPVVDDSLAFRIEGGRHPVVERSVSGSFVPNDCDLSPERRLWLLTGPNMA